MKLIFMGTPAIAVPVLQSLVESKHDIVAVVTQPDRASGRGKKICSPPIKEKALQHNIPVIQPESLSSPEFHSRLRALKADLSVVVAFSILPTSVFATTRLGAINLHASLLPKYRGAAPINWAIINGETKTGITIFQLDGKMDHGQTLAQASLEIYPDETAGELGYRLCNMGAPVLLEAINNLEKGIAKALPQNHLQATTAPKLKKEDGRLNWQLPAETLHNKIRGLNPYPICFTTFSALKQPILRIHRSEIIRSPGQSPGTISISDDKYPVVSCGADSLKLIEVQCQGKAKVDGKVFLNGIQDKSVLKFDIT